MRLSLGIMRMRLIGVVVGLVEMFVLALGAIRRIRLRRVCG